MSEGCFKVVAKCLPSCFEFQDKHKKMAEKWKRQNKHEGEVYTFVGLEVSITINKGPPNTLLFFLYFFFVNQLKIKNNW